jgi:hypothetical protein
VREIQEWEYIFANDPANDSELAMEITHKTEEIVIIYQTKRGLDFCLFWLENEFDAPFDWFLSQMLLAQKDLPASKIKNFGDRDLVLTITNEEDKEKARYKLFKGKDNFANILQTKKGLLVNFEYRKNKISIAFDWLLDVMKKAKKELPASKIENMGE